MKTIILISLMFLLTVFYGCSAIIPPPLTASETFTYDVDDIISSDDVINSETINLFEDEDYVEHHENIVSVDQVAIVGTITNNSGSAVQFILYADADDTSDYSTLYEIDYYATRIFTIPTFIPAGGNPIDIDWEDGVEWMENPAFLADLIINDGIFKIYAIANETPFDMVAELTIIITVSVSL